MRENGSEVAIDVLPIFGVNSAKKTSIFDYNSDNQIKNISIIGDYKPNETWEEVFSNKLLVVIQIIRLKLQNLFLNDICNYKAWMALLDEKQSRI